MILDLSKNAFVVMYVLNAVLALSCLGTIHLLLSRLRREHSVVHKALGEPSLFQNNTVSNGLRVLGFLLTRKYREVPDEHVRKLGSIALALLVTVLATGVVTTMLFFPWLP